MTGIIFKQNGSSIPVPIHGTGSAPREQENNLLSKIIEFFDI
jgi:hypothetical protein